MKLLKTFDVPMDLSSVALHEAISKLGGENIRLAYGCGYRHHEVLQVVFYDRGKLDIPMEISYILDPDAWLITTTTGIFYSPGA